MTHSQATPPRGSTQAPSSEPKPASKLGGHGLVFLKEFIRSPKLVGTAFASSPKVSKAMVEHLDLASAKVVIELGAGTGAVTQEILPRLAKGATFFAVEFSPSLAQNFRARFPGVTLHVADAATLPEICKHAGIKPGEVDIVVSALPWMLFSEDQRGEMMRMIARMLRPRGVVSLLSQRAAGLPGVAGFRTLMRSVFASVEVTRSIWGALPPSFIYRCVKA